jgi:hypothetical protein
MMTWIVWVAILLMTHNTFDWPGWLRWPALVVLCLVQLALHAPAESGDEERTETV